MTTTFPIESTLIKNDSEGHWVAVALELWYHPTPTLSAHIGWGSPMDAEGLNLPGGYIISGKNVEGGPLLFQAGVTTHF